MATYSIWQCPDSGIPRTYDVVIVGAGVMGAATAYWLHQWQPELKVALVDAHFPGAGASGRNAGFILQGITSDYALDEERYGVDVARKVLQFTRENRVLVQEVAEKMSIGLEQSGSLHAALAPEEVERLRLAASRLRAEGVGALCLSATDINRRASSQHFEGGLYLTSGAVVHPYALVQGMVRASRAEVFDQHPVLAIEEHAEGKAVVTRAHTFIAPHVVVTLGAYAPQLLPSLSAYVRPVRAQMMALGPADTRWLTQPVYSHQGYYYIRQRADGVVLVGGARHLHVNEEVGYDDLYTEAVQRDLHRYVDLHFPWAASLPVVRRWSGTMGFSPDGLPVIDDVPGLSGVVFATGFTGHGMAYALRVGQLLSRRVLLGGWPEAHAMFAASRF